jgi:hypothetical protein
MPFSHEFLDGGRRLLRQGSGALSARDLIDGDLAVLRIIEQLPPASRPRHVLVDLTQVTAIDFTIADLHQLVDLNERTSALVPSLHLALVTAWEPMVAMAITWQTLGVRLGWTTMLFPTRGEAQQWLDAQGRQAPAQ